MTVLTDDEWSALKDAPDAVRSRRRRPTMHERQTVEAVVWRARNGAKWRSLPPKFGPWARAAHLHLRRSRLGVWERAFDHARDAGRPALAEVMPQGATSVRAPHRAAGAKAGPA